MYSYTNVLSCCWKAYICIIFTDLFCLFVSSSLICSVSIHCLMNVTHRKAQSQMFSLSAHVTAFMNTKYTCVREFVFAQDPRNGNSRFFEKMTKTTYMSIVLVVYTWLKWIYTYTLFCNTGRDRTMPKKWRKRGKKNQHTCVCECVLVYVCMYVCMCVRVYVTTPKDRENKVTKTNTYVCLCICVSACTHIYAKTMRKCIPA